MADYLILTCFLMVNAMGVVMVFWQLPGTWVILISTAITSWWFWDKGTIGLGTLAAVGGLAVLGELIELFTAVAAARRGGASRRGMILSVVGAMSGAVLGTILIAIPIAGTLIGCCIGAGSGVVLGDLWAGHHFQSAMLAGRGAAIGRLWGTLLKCGIAAAMWLVSAAAIWL